MGGGGGGAGDGATGAAAAAAGAGASEAGRRVSRPPESLRQRRLDDSCGIQPPTSPVLLPLPLY